MLRIIFSIITALLSLVIFSNIWFACKDNRMANLILLLVATSTISILIFKPKIFALPFNHIAQNTEDRKIFYTRDEMLSIFPISKDLEDNWESISKESNDMKYENNIWQSFETNKKEFWEDWTTYPLKIFGRNHRNIYKCKTIEKILDGHDEVVTAFFSKMSPGKIITPHYGPYEGYLRYHLGLKIPKGNDVSITVGDIKYEWKNGESVMFNECFKHSAINDSPEERIILFIDVKRNFKNSFMNNINELITFGAKYSPHTYMALRR